LESPLEGLLVDLEAVFASHVVLDSELKHEVHNSELVAVRNLLSELRGPQDEAASVEAEADIPGALSEGAGLSVPVREEYLVVEDLKDECEDGPVRQGAL